MKNLADIKFENPDRIADDLNRISGFLAKKDIKSLDKKSILEYTGKDRVDTFVLLGNSIIASIDKLAKAIQNNVADYYIIAGGKGHSTDLLFKTAKSKFDPGEQISQNVTEAEILYGLLTEHYQVKRSHIYLEKESTNCGDNAIKVKALLERKNIKSTSFILTQDPTMQLRTHASFRKVWENEDRVTFINDPVFIPRVMVSDGQLYFENQNIPGIWPMERFISLVMSEIPRLRNNEQGYGPKGKGYISAIDVPAGIEEPYERLLAEFKEFIRPI